MNYGFIRVAAVVPTVNVADCEANVDHIIKNIHEAYKRKAQLIVFPELSITGYTCGDLFKQTTLIKSAFEGMERISSATLGLNALVVVGLPIVFEGRMFNCAVAIFNGEIVGVVPKTYIPNYHEFYEKRWFTSSYNLRKNATINIDGKEVPFGCDLLFTMGDAKIGCEICEDLWAPVPPSSMQAINGANILVNLSATNELTGKHNRLMSLITQQSAGNIAAYVYASSGYGESTSDLVFAGNAIIAELGNVIKKGARFNVGEQMAIADIDVEKINNARINNGTFGDSLEHYATAHREIEVPVMIFDNQKLERKIEKNPFVPTDDAMLNSHCEEIFNIQTQGLMRRLQFTGTKSLVVGVSGGLDSTLALLIADRAFGRLGYDKKNIIGITMPGFGTSDRTYTNALQLMHSMGITVKEISIANAVLQHFKDIDHDVNVHDATYENSQARERTQILMDCANKYNGMVLGTGDLSELALGWCTYNGDHMSMYSVNAGVAKTLVKCLVTWIANNVAAKEWGDEAKRTLLDIVDTPISPELTPADNEGKINQKTEDLVGPYELHDFFLFNMLAYGFSPSKIFILAKEAFADEYDGATIKKWLTVFCRRFFSQQFKRSCLPDGPKVGIVGLSPRGDWRMPSDACAALWIKECENLEVD